MSKHEYFYDICISLRRLRASLQYFETYRITLTLADAIILINISKSIENDFRYLARKSQYNSHRQIKWNISSISFLQQNTQTLLFLGSLTYLPVSIRNAYASHLTRARAILEYLHCNKSKYGDISKHCLYIE